MQPANTNSSARTSSTRTALLVVTALIAAVGLFLLGMWVSRATASEVTVQGAAEGAEIAEPTTPTPAPPAPTPEVESVEPGFIPAPAQPVPEGLEDLFEDFDLDRFFDGDFSPQDLFDPEFQAQLDEFFANPPALRDGLDQLDPDSLLTPELEAQIEDLLGREFNLDDFGFEGEWDLDEFLADDFFADDFDVWAWLERFLGASADA